MFWGPPFPAWSLLVLAVLNPPPLQRSFICFICTGTNHRLPGKRLTQPVAHRAPIGSLSLCRGLWFNNNPAILFSKLSALIGALLINVVRVGCAEKHLLMHYTEGSIEQMYEISLLSCSFTRKSRDLGLNQWCHLCKVKFDFARVRPRWSSLPLRHANKFLFTFPVSFTFFLDLPLLLWASYLKDVYS